ncbi:hypothetical protein J7K50_09895 [bacterium]|nr:hypothetical protein [bacterium]
MNGNSNNDSDAVKEHAPADEKPEAIREPIFSESVKTGLKIGIPEFVNPHPKLSALTWIVLAVVVIAGTFLYWQNVWQANSREGKPHSVLVNGVRLPTVLNDYWIMYGGMSLGATRVGTTPELPAEGVIEGVTYGEPMKNAGLIVYSKPATDQESELESYLIFILSEWGVPADAITFKIAGDSRTTWGEKENKDSGIVAAVGVAPEGRLWVVCGFATDGEADSLLAKLGSAMNELVVVENKKEKPNQMKLLRH